MEPEASIAQERQMRARIRQRNRSVGMPEQVTDRILIGVEQLAFDDCIELAIEAEVEEPVERVLIIFASQLADIAADERLMLRIDDLEDRHMVQAVIREAVWDGAAARFGLHCRAKLRISENLTIALTALGHHRRTPRQNGFQRVGMAQGELHAERETADLSPELPAALARFADPFELVEHELGIIGIDEQRRNHDWTPVARGDLLQPGHRRVHSLREHEYAAAGFAQRCRQLRELMLIGQ